MKIKDQQELNNELMNAIRAKNDELAKELMKDGAELNPKDSPELLLATAIYYNPNLVTALIVRGAHINPLYKIVETLLTAAIQTLNTGLIFWLLNEKVDVNPKNCQFSP